MSIDEDEEESKQSNPTYSKKTRTKQETDYREYLRPLLPYIRFPLMDGVFFTSNILPLQILPHSSATSLVQFLTHPSLPDQNVLDKVTLAKRRDAQSLVIAKAHPRFEEDPPDPLPIAVNKGHSTFLKGTLGGEEAILFKGRFRSFLEGTMLGMRIRFLSVPSEKWRFILPLWGRDIDGTSIIHSKPLISVSVLRDGEGLQMKHPNSEAQKLVVNTEYDWKSEFFVLREIIVALRKDEDPEDSTRIKLEANLIVNGRRVKRFEYGYPKDSLAGRGFKLRRGIF